MKAVRTLYLAAPYQTMFYMRHLRDALQTRGWEVNAHWLDEDPEKFGLKSEYAIRDMREISEADAVIVYNPYAYERSGSGGRHVELGLALAQKKLVIVFGRPSNVFHLAPGVRLATSIEHIFTILEEHRTCFMPSSSAA
jgi:nucleoside 2-deoxyribosyltransferase